MIPEWVILSQEARNLDAAAYIASLKATPLSEKRKGKYHAVVLVFLT